MKILKMLIATPIRRFVLGLLLCVVGVYLSFMPLLGGFICLIALILLLMLRQGCDDTWFQGRAASCPVCNEMTGTRLIKLRIYMFPILPFGRKMDITVDVKYYLVCGKCLETHVGEQDFKTISIISAGGLAHMKEITKQEFDELSLNEAQ